MLGAWVRRERAKRGWLQRDLARRLGVSQKHVSRFERGASLPGPEVVYTLARLFDADPAEVYQLAYPDRAAPPPAPDPGAAAVAEFERLRLVLTPEEWAILLTLARYFPSLHTR